MKFTDIFVGRPVLATVISFMILLVGLRSMGLSPWLYIVIAVLILAFTITKVWGTKQDVQR